ncbi:Hint domain-containing protein [Paracoccus pacificus]|uniref:Hint domain-containing protein n=1 Tax=Paracoccus pacificus TaxID=1463598 RepID=A0ABW4R3Q1_9RHOB
MDFGNTNIANPSYFYPLILNSQENDNNFGIPIDFSGAQGKYLSVSDDDAFFNDPQRPGYNDTNQTVAADTTFSTTTIPAGNRVHPICKVYVEAADGSSVWISYLQVTEPGAAVDAGGPHTNLIVIEQVNGTFDPTATYYTAVRPDNAAYIAYNADGTFPYTKTPIICFSDATLIETDHGQVCAGVLRVGDLVRTQDHGYQPIRWIGRRTFGATELKNDPDLRPVRIRAGALGTGIPSSDLVVSPQHRVLIRSKISQSIFATDEVLAGVKHLLVKDGVEVVDDLEGVTYVHFLLDRHEIVYANGAPAETLHTGAEALKSVGPAARAEIFSIFPELERNHQRETARLALSGRDARKLAARHAKNGKPFVEPIGTLQQS